MVNEIEIAINAIDRASFLKYDEEQKESEIRKISIETCLGRNEN